MQKSSKWSRAHDDIKIWRARALPRALRAKIFRKLSQKLVKKHDFSIFYHFQVSKARAHMRAVTIFCCECILRILNKVSTTWMDTIFQKLTIIFEFENLLFSKILKKKWNFWKNFKIFSKIKIFKILQKFHFWYTDVFFCLFFTFLSKKYDF